MGLVELNETQLPFVRLSEKVSKKIKTSGTCDEDVSRKTVQINKEKSSVNEADKVRTET